MTERTYTESEVLALVAAENHACAVISNVASPECQAVKNKIEARLTAPQVAALEKVKAEARIEGRVARFEELRPEYSRMADRAEKAEAKAKRLREGLEWALDILDMYDEQLVKLGEPHERVYSEMHLKGKTKARTALSAPAVPDGKS